MSQLPPQGNDANRLDFEKQVAAAARIARNSNLLQEGQGLELVSTTGLASCNTDACQADTFKLVSAEILDTGYYTRIADVVPTAVDSNMGVARGKLCVQTCEVDTHQLPAHIDMHTGTHTPTGECPSCSH